MSDHELLVSNNDLLQTIWLWLRIGVGLGCLILFVVVGMFAFKWHSERRLRETFGMIQERVDQDYLEMTTLLKATRSAAEAARDNRKETAEAVKQLSGSPSREDLGKKIEEIPTRTADQVVGKLTESKDDWREQMKAKGEHA